MVLVRNSGGGGGGLSGSEDRSEGDNSIQFMDFWRVGEKSFK